MKITVIVDGAKALSAALKQKSEADFVNVCKKTTTSLFRYAAKNTPVSKTKHGGTLRRSLRAEYPSMHKDGEVGYTMEYAPHVEYGHRLVIRGQERGFVPGQYFLKKSVDDARSDFITFCREELKK